MSEIPDAWLLTARDAVVKTFGQREWNLAHVVMPTALAAVRPLIEAQAADRVDALAGELRGMIGRLQEHIDERAREIAEPQIDAARQDGARIVAEQRAGIEAMRDPDEPRGEQWATRLRWPSDGSEEIMPSYGESLARSRVANLPKMHLALLRRTVTYGPWVEVHE